MAIKDLLIAYDGNPAAQNAARLGVQMAMKYGAGISGVYVTQPESYGSHVRQWMSQDMLAQLRDAERETRAKIADNFRQTLKEAGYGGEIGWVELEGQAHVLLPRVSRYYDLMLIGQFTSERYTAGRQLQAEEMVMRAGKPMIVVPRNYTARPFKEHAMVAWDGSRSAARALTDAMQILETKKRLDVVHLGDDRIGWDPPVPNHDIIAHMGRHGVNATRVPLDPAGRSKGATLLDYAAKTDPDVLVMGAYGRGKFGGMLFGSLTRYVLDNLNVPTLLSH